MLPRRLNSFRGSKKKGSEYIKIINRVSAVYISEKTEKGMGDT
jgi:hypothetical protein